MVFGTWSADSAVPPDSNTNTKFRLPNTELTNYRSLHTAYPTSSRKFVSQPRHGHDQLRLSGIFLKLLAQAAHVDVDGPGEGVFVVAPDFLQQHFAGERGAGVEHEVAQQAEFAGRQGELPSFAEHSRAAQIDAYVSEFVDVAVIAGRSLPPPDLRFHPCH